MKLIEHNQWPKKIKRASNVEERQRDVVVYVGGKNGSELQIKLKRRRIIPESMTTHDYGGQWRDGDDDG